VDPVPDPLKVSLHSDQLQEVHMITGATIAWLVEALSYMPEGCGF
jgi:hypothetical protein